jgi:hypothetical protein
MKDPLSQLLRDADVNAAPAARRATSRGIADSVRRRRRRQQIRTQIVTAACVVIAVMALGFSLRSHDREIEIAKVPTPPPAVETQASRAAIAQWDIDAQVADLTARRLEASESKRRSSPASAAASPAGRIDIQEARDRAALVLIYEGDGYASRRHGNDAVASWQRAIALFPQSHWADVARQRLKDYST